MLSYSEYKRVVSLLEKKNWRFAKTMPQMPHYYSLRVDWKNNQLFDEVVMFIREHGYKGKFYSREYIYLNANGVKYWTMGDPLETTILINRTEIKRESPSKNVVEMDFQDQNGESRMILNVMPYETKKSTVPIEEFSTSLIPSVINAMDGMASYIHPKYIGRVIEMIGDNGVVNLSFRNRVGEVTSFVNGEMFVYDGASGAIELIEQGYTPEKVTQTETIFRIEKQ